MKGLLNDLQVLIDYNYLFNSVARDEQNTDNKTEKRSLNNIDFDPTISKTKELFISIINKSKKLIGKNNIEKLCKAHNIRIENNNVVSTKNNIYEALNRFIDSLIITKSNIIKIMLHNLSHEMDMTILEPVLSRSNRSLFFCETEKNIDRNYFT